MGEKELSKQKPNYPIGDLEGSVIGNPGSWVPRFRALAILSLVFLGMHSL